MKDGFCSQMLILRWFQTIFDLRFGLLAKFCAGSNTSDLLGRLGGELWAKSKCFLICSISLWILWRQSEPADSS